MFDEFYLKQLASAYKKTRYLRKADNTAIDIRRADICANMWTTDKLGHVQRVSDPERREVFLTKFFELEIENAIRNQLETIEFDEKQIRINASNRYKRVHLKTITGKFPKLDFLVRYSERKFIDDAFYRGAIQIAPASSYKEDSSLNAAQSDEELRHFSVTPNEQLHFKMYGSNTLGEPERELPVTLLELFRYMEVPDFYVLCCSASFNCRMFHDFRADAAIIISDISTFLSRINIAVLNQASSTFKHGKIAYYDPYLVERQELIPGFSKHFRYAYQDEYRLLWKVSSQTPLQKFFVNIGSMHDIASLVTT